MKVNTLMNVDSSRIVKPEERDHMPVEVAIERLTNAKGRYTNRDRKVAKQAREKVYPSISPIRREDDHFIYVPTKTRDLDEKLVAKMKEKSLTQLLKLAKRAVTRRRAVQTQYFKLGAKPLPKNVSEQTSKFLEARRNQALVLLEMAANRLDRQYDAVCEELSRRGLSRTSVKLSNLTNPKH